MGVLRWQWQRKARPRLIRTRHRFKDGWSIEGKRPTSFMETTLRRAAQVAGKPSPPAFSSAVKPLPAPVTRSA